MFSLWWNEKWVRYLVISLSPLGLVDGIYTMMLFNAHGAQFEYNPIVRMALESNYWFVWFIADVVSFSLFAMVAGSYYLHTRSSLFGNRTGWLAGLIGFRVGAVMYNVIVFYEGLLAAFGALVGGLLTFVVIDNLLNRTADMSRTGFRHYWMSKYNRIRDYLILREVRKAKVGSQPPMAEERDEYGQDSKGVWLKRAGYLTMALLVFTSTPFILLMVGDITGASTWRDIFGGVVWWNQFSGTAFLIAFATIIALAGGIMFFILKAFHSEEGGW
jgi:hypothetical protein